MLGFEYNISQLGKIKAYIYGQYAIDCYTFLKNQKFIEKLHNMNQLGVIPYTTLGTSHSRYEYVILQIYLVNLFQGREYILDISKEKQEKFHLGLSSNIKIDTNISIEEPSGAEILIIWILLFNSGHLIGTFASEKGFMESLKNNHDFFMKFKRYIPNTVNKYFLDSLKKHQYMEFHKYLILFYINSSKNNTKNLKMGKKSIFLMSKLIELYLEPNNEKIIKLKNIYHEIRKLSYLFLDSQYSSISLNFMLSSLLINLSDNIDELMNPLSQINLSLDSLDNLLAHDLYYSNESISELRIHSDYIKEKMNKKWTIHDLKKEIKNYSFFKPKSLPSKKIKSLHLYFEIDKVLESITNVHFDSQLGMKWDSKLGETFLITIEKNTKFDFTVLNVVYKNNNIYSQLLFTGRLLNKIIGLKNKYHADLREKINNDPKMKSLYIAYDNYLEEIFNSPFKEIMFFVLENITENHYFKFDENSNQIFSIFGENTIEKRFNKIKNDKLSESKKHEKNVIKEFSQKLISKKSKALVSQSSIKCYLNSNDNENAEIDGLILTFKDKKLHLYLIEAKKQNHSSQTDSINSLKSTVDKLNFKTKNPNYKTIPGIKGAYCHLIISNDN